MFARAAASFFVLAQASLALAGNDAVYVNPSDADVHLTTHGSDWLWAEFCVMCASALGVTLWALFTPAGKRAFHWIGIAILFTASVAYFSLAANLGRVPIDVEFVRYKSDLYTGPLTNGTYTRDIWWVRYIDWAITTPLLLLELLLGTGMPLSGIFATIFFDLVMVVGGLAGALVPSVYKWGYFTGATVAMLYVFWTLLFPGRTNAAALGTEAHKAYMMSACVLAFLWLLYPVAWGLADGGNVISTDGEMVFYGVLDLLAKPVFLFIHLFALRKVPYEVFELQSGHYSVGSLGAKHGGYTAAHTGNTHPEKRALGANTPAAGNANTGIAAHGAPQTGTVPGVVHPVDGRRSDVTAV